MRPCVMIEQIVLNAVGKEVPAIKLLNDKLNLSMIRMLPETLSISTDILIKPY